jgi:hypothetical protein
MNNEQLGFFQTIKASFFNPDFYKKMPKQSFGSALWYFFRLLTLCLFIGSVFVILIPFFSHADEWLDQAGNVLDVYPDELIVTIDDSEVSMNMEGPVFIPLPEFIEGEFTLNLEASDSDVEDQTKLTHLAVIDTETEFSSETFYSYESFFWLGKDELYTLNDNGGLQVFQLKGIEHFEIDKEVVDVFGAKILEMIKPLAPLFLVLSFFASLFGFMLFSLSRILILALFVWLIVSAYFKIKKIDFRGAYITSLYASSPALILVTLTVILRTFLSVPHIPYFSFLLTLIVVSVNYNAGKNKSLTT